MYTTPKTHCLRKKKRDLYGCEEEKPQKKAPDLFAIKIHKKTPEERQYRASKVDPRAPKIRKSYKQKK